jgi:hypothetical protein
MNVAIFSPYAINTPHFEIELELAQQHLDEGDTVYIIGCDSSMSACDVNLKHDQEKCLACRGRRASGMAMLNKREGKIKSVSLNDLSVNAKFPPFPSESMVLSDLKSVRIDNFDVGLGIISSLVSAYRKPEISLDSIRSVTENLYQSSLKIYFGLRSFFEQLSIDRCYFHNGRFAPLRAAMRACEYHQVPFYTVEFNSNNFKYVLFENTMPHDIDFALEKIEELWNENSDWEEKSSIGESFFKNRIEGTNAGLINFRARMSAGSMPSYWNESKRNVSIFISSEDEFVAIGDLFDKHNPNIYDSQLDGIRKICQSLMDSDKQDIQLYLRVHPNLKGVNNDFTLQIEELSVFPCLHIIRAEEKVDSYLLVQRSEKTLSFGSSVGIEAVFLGKPSVLLGSSLYNKEGLYCPKNHEEVMQMILGSLEPKDKIHAIKYGYYMLSFGSAYTYYQPEAIYKGKFKSKYIEPDLPSKIKMKLNRFFSGTLHKTVKS